MERATRQLQSILTHYFDYLHREAGLRWDFENEGEVYDAVQAFADAVQTEIREQVAAALDSRKSGSAS